MDLNYEIREAVFPKRTVCAVTGADPRALENWFVRDTLPTAPEARAPRKHRRYSFVQVVGIATMVRVLARLKLRPTEAHEIARQVMARAVLTFAGEQPHDLNYRLICWFEKGELKFWDTAHPLKQMVEVEVNLDPTITIPADRIIHLVWEKLSEHLGETVSLTYRAPDSADNETAAPK